MHFQKIAPILISDYPNSFKNNLMKASIKKTMTQNASVLVRTLFLSLLFIAFVALTIYILINSPA